MEDQNELKTEEMLAKARRWCAYQERCEAEVRSYISDLGAVEEMQEEVLEALRKEKFLDELRFVKAFAGGKFRTLGWGKIKIAVHLRQRGAKEEYISTGLSSIPEEDYLAAVKKLAEKKRASLAKGTARETKLRLLRFLQQRGFEREVIEKVLRGIQ